MNYDKIIDIVRSMRTVVFDDGLREEVRLKGKDDFVTRVDTTISEVVGARLRELYPDIGFMSEERDNGALPERRWILDPIDGTTNLVYGLQNSSISLALYDRGQVEFGVVYDPYRQETFHAVRGQGAFLNGRPMPKAPVRPMREAIIEFGAGCGDKRNAGAVFDMAREIFESCVDLRRMCSTALAVCYIAAGRLDGYFERNIKPWDYAAAGLILRECGGFISQWDGRAMPYDGESSILCGTEETYKGLGEIIKRHGENFI